MVCSDDMCSYNSDIIVCGDGMCCFNGDIMV